MRRSTGGTRKRAKRVSGTKRKTHRRRRHHISGMGDIGGMIEKAGGLVVGAVAARELNTLISGFVQLSPMMSGLLQMGVGLALPKFLKGSFGQNMGDGMVANGGMVVVVSTGMISGASDRMAYQISGTSNLPVLAGTSNLPVVNGTTRIQNSNPPVRSFLTGRKFNPYV